MYHFSKQDILEKRLHNKVLHENCLKNRIMFGLRGTNISKVQC